MSPSVATIVSFLVRRGLTMLGGSAAALSNQDVTQAIGVVTVIVNEIIQAWLAYAAKRKEADAKDGAVSVQPR